MEDSIGSCVICAQNLCINNFSSLPCGHTFHYKCILRWLLHSEQCPTCRSRTSPRNIVKRLYFANCDDKAVNGVGTSTAVAVADGNKSASTKNTPEKIDEFDDNYHGNEESYNNNSDSDSDSEDRADGDSTDSNDSSVATSEGSEFEAESEAYNQESEYHETISDADMASAFDASVSDTSSVSLGTFSESFSENDAVSVASLNHDNMETSDSFDDHEEVGNGDNNTYTSLLLIEHVDDDDNDYSSDDENSSDSDDSDDSNNDCDLHEYGHLLDHFALDVRVFNQHIS